MEQVLSKYGSKVIVLDAKGGDIGKGWVPPLGGLSPINPEYVVHPGYAEELAKAGYRPQGLQQQIIPVKFWTSLGNLLLLALLLSMVGVVVNEA